MNLTKTSAARAAVWSFVENAGLALVSFISLIVYSRFLSPADFGLFSMVLAFVEILSVIVTMLFHDALVQQDGVTEAHFDSAFTFTMALSLVLFGGCLLVAPVFAHFVGNPSSARVLRWSAVSLPFTALSATLVPQQQRKLEFRSLALRSVVGRITGAVLGVILVVMGAHFWGLVAQYVLIQVVGSAVLWIAATDHPKLRFHIVPFRALLGFGLYAVGGLFVGFLVSRLFMIVVGAMLGARAAGYLNLSFRIVDVLWAIAATAVSQAALPVLARLQSDTVRLRWAYAKAVEFSCLTLYPCFFGIAVTAPEIVEMLFGRQWLVSVPYVATLALLVVVRAPRLLSRPILMAVGRPQDVLIGAIADLVVMFALVAACGASTLPRAMAIWAGREIVPMLLMAYVLKRGTRIGYLDQFRGSTSALVGSVAMGAMVCALRGVVPSTLAPLLRFLVFVPSGVATFVLIVWLIDRASLMNAIGFVSAARRSAPQSAIS